MQTQPSHSHPAFFTSEERPRMPRSRLWISALIGVGAGLGVALIARGAFLRREAEPASEPMPDPRTLDTMGGVHEGAVTETIGGHPEDMNGMPPAVELDSTRPVHDGSDLRRKISV